MPNVRGLTTAPDLLMTLTQGVTTPYGPHTTVTLTGRLITLRAVAGTVLATVDLSSDRAKAKADLSAIDGQTVTAVNALLRPYGAVRSYWRAKPGEVPYRWHPVNGRPVKAGRGTVRQTAPAQPAPVQIAQPAPVAAAPVVATVVTQQPAQPGIRITVQAHGGPGVSIPTERRYEGKGSAARTRTLTKTYSQVGDVIVPTEDLDTLNRAWTMRAAGHPTSVIITGPSGTAKTRLAEQFAYSKGVPFLVVEGQSIQTAADWYGGFVPDASGAGAPFRWEWSPFGLALLRGEPMVIVIDELNRPENERALNGLMGLLAWTAEVQPLGAPQALRLAPGILVVATVNEGVEFVGTVEIDAAVRNRFTKGVRMDYTPETVEVRVLREHAQGIDPEVAKRLVRVAAGQRAKRDDDTLFPSHNVLSTRVLIDIAQDIVMTGCEPVAAIWSAVRAQFTKEDEPGLSVLIEAQFGATPESVDDLPADDDLEQMLSVD